MFTLDVLICETSRHILNESQPYGYINEYSILGYEPRLAMSLSMNHNHMAHTIFIWKAYFHPHESQNLSSFLAFLV